MLDSIRNESFALTTRVAWLKFLSSGKDVIFDIDCQGTQQLKKIENLSIVTFFILPPNIEVLKNRLLNRHKGQEDLIKQRMNKFSDELSHWNEYNYVVVNDDLEVCYNQILNIIKSEKKGISKKQDIKMINDKIFHIKNARRVKSLISGRVAVGFNITTLLILIFEIYL